METYLKCFLINSVVVLFIAFDFPNCYGHGRLVEPPSRASAWRYGFQTPPDYNDHELYCGGFTRQWKRNEGKCGICGDAWDLPEPRPHENGGQWGQAVVVRKYLPRSEILIRVELTASHMGFFEFRLCPDPNADQDCLDKHLLQILGGSPSQPMPSDISTRFYPRNGSRIYEMKAQLPDIKCDQCVLQWRYVAGNNWGICPDGNGAVGCGPQEEFRSCADVALGEGAYKPIRPMPPSPRTTVGPRIPFTTTKTTQQQSSEESSSAWIIVIVVLIIIIVCSLVACYMRRYHSQLVKKWFGIAGKVICWNQNKRSPTKAMSAKSPIAKLENPFVHKNDDIAYAFNESFNNPPVPPPRAKRNSKVKEITNGESNVF